MKESFREYIESAELRRVQETLRRAGYKKDADPFLFTSVVLSNDLWEATHVNDDHSGYSCFHIRAYGMEDTNTGYERVVCNLIENPDPALYFMFPTYGIAVPLRPGDTMIFNPRVPHGASRKTVAYENFIVKSWSAYLDLTVVGGSKTRTREVAEQPNRHKEEVAREGKRDHNTSTDQHEGALTGLKRDTGGSVVKKAKQDETSAAARTVSPQPQPIDHEAGPRDKVTRYKSPRECKRHGEKGGEPMWCFKRIVGHEGPLQPGDRNYQGCRYSLLVEWENHEVTMEPLHTFGDDAPFVCALYAKEKGLLEVDDWKHFQAYLP